MRLAKCQSSLKLSDSTWDFSCSTFCRLEIFHNKFLLKADNSPLASRKDKKTRQVPEYGQGRKEEK